MRPTLEKSKAWGSSDNPLLCLLPVTHLNWGEIIVICLNLSPVGWACLKALAASPQHIQSSKTALLFIGLKTLIYIVFSLNLLLISI